jgi:ribosomal protein S18 acetylase RimI-like enzyme
LTIKIRPLKKEDKAALLLILKNTPEFTPDEVIIAEEVVDGSLDKPETSGYFSLGAETETGAFAGFISYGLIPLTQSSWDLYWLAVDRKQQGKGTGTALLKAAEEQIIKAGGKMSFIETSSREQYGKTRHFYITNDYVEICNIADFYAPGDGKIVYRKKLAC